MRKKYEIIKEVYIVENKVWYNRHQVCMQKKYLEEKDPRVIKNIRGGIKAAKKMEKEYGKKNLGPYTDFEWGMLSGRLETLRWVLGEDWNQLDT
ncbi:hypothetical protein KKC45_02820 [Patescibacteria group bacterium]|nr:hypothetical protein [Patescibacteria group bacterium]